MRALIVIALLSAELEAPKPSTCTLEGQVLLTPNKKTKPQFRTVVVYVDGPIGATYDGVGAERSDGDSRGARLQRTDAGAAHRAGAEAAAAAAGDRRGLLKPKLQFTAPVKSTTSIGSGDTRNLTSSR